MAIRRHRRRRGRGADYAKSSILFQRGAVDVRGYEAAAIFRRTHGELLEVALRRIRIRPEDFRKREPTGPEFPFEVEAAGSVRRPIAALSAHDVFPRPSIDSGERIERVNALQTRDSEASSFDASCLLLFSAYD